MGVLKIMGARPKPDERMVRSGKIVTAAGVSAGIDLALWLAGEMSKASKETQQLAKEMMDDRMPADQRRLVPKIAWRRFIDLIRTGK